MSQKPTRFRVIPAEEGMTLRNLLTRRLRETNKERATEIIRAGGVYVNRYRVRLPQVRVAPGERITVYPDASEIEPVDPDTLVFVHRDPDFVVLDKPAGVPVAATKDRVRGTLTEALIKKLQDEGVSRPYVGLVHRLDQGASGLVLLTIRGVANRSLHQQFVDHRIGRRYRIGVHGDVPPQFTCDRPLFIRRNASVQVVEPGHAGAVSATTHFERLGPGPASDDGVPHTVVAARLETGRTHQIRAHAAASGFPIVGDRRYGPRTGESDAESPPPLLLHAHELSFEHPASGARIELSSRLPDWARVRPSAD